MAKLPSKKRTLTTFKRYHRRFGRKVEVAKIPRATFRPARVLKIGGSLPTRSSRRPLVQAIQQARAESFSRYQILVDKHSTRRAARRALVPKDSEAERKRDKALEVARQKNIASAKAMAKLAAQATQKLKKKATLSTAEKRVLSKVQMAEAAKAAKKARLAKIKERGFALKTREAKRKGLQSPWEAKGYKGTKGVPVEAKGGGTKYQSEPDYNTPLSDEEATLDLEPGVWKKAQKKFKGKSQLPVQVEKYNAKGHIIGTYIPSKTSAKDAVGVSKKPGVTFLAPGKKGAKQGITKWKLNATQPSQNPHHQGPPSHTPSEAAKIAWDTKRKKYGKSGRRNRWAKAGPSTPALPVKISGNPKKTGKAKAKVRKR